MRICDYYVDDRRHGCLHHECVYPSCGYPDCDGAKVGPSEPLQYQDCVDHNHQFLWLDNCRPHKWRYDLYLSSYVWFRRSLAIKTRESFSCQSCRKDYSDGLRLDVHHIHYRTLFNETGNELITLCAACHKIEHQRGLKAREWYWREKLKARGLADIPFNEQHSKRAETIESFDEWARRNGFSFSGEW